MNQKGNILIFLLVGIIVLAAIGGAFYLGKSTTPKPSPPPAAPSQTTPSPTQDASREPTDYVASPAPNGAGETANWKTYTNTKYGYSVKYPNNLEVRTGGMGLLPITEESRIIIDSPKIKTKQSGRLTIRVVNELCQAEPNNKLISIKGGLEQFADRIWELNSDNEPLKETNINGSKAYQFFTKYSWSDDCGEASLNQKNQALITEKDRLIYVILFPTDNSIYLQILSTFKFTQ